MIIEYNNKNNAAKLIFKHDMKLQTDVEQ